MFFALGIILGICVTILLMWVIATMEENRELKEKADKAKAELDRLDNYRGPG